MESTYFIEMAKENGQLKTALDAEDRMCYLAQVVCDGKILITHFIPIDIETPRLRRYLHEMAKYYDSIFKSAKNLLVVNFESVTRANSPEGIA